MSLKPKILVLIDYYKPGFRSGGPLPVISGWVQFLKTSADVFILTRNHDWGESTPYPGVLEKQWNDLEGVKIQYLAENSFTSGCLQEIIDETKINLVLVNSFFSPWSRKYFLWKKFGRIKDLPSTLVCHGEFSVGALTIKRKRKWLYTLLSRYLGQYKNLSVLALSQTEQADLQACGLFKKIELIEPLLSKPDSSINKNSKTGPHSDESQLVFFGRISPMKNLEFLLASLPFVKKKIHLHIWGPPDAHFPDYVEKCRKIADSVANQNLRISFHGEIHPKESSQVWRGKDLMLLPSKGENFGVVIWESLLAGVPCLISDRTSWNWISGQEGLWISPLNSPQEWGQKIEHILKSLEQKKTEVGAGIHQVISLTLARQSQSEQALRALFIND